MQIDNLINFLKNDHKKVNVLKSPIIRFLIWICINALFLIFFIGIQTATKGNIHIPESVSSFCLLLILFLFSSWIIWKRNIPDEHPKWELLVPTLLIVLWIGSMLFQLFSGGEEKLTATIKQHTSYVDYACAFRISLMALFTATILVFQIRKGYYHPGALPIVLLTLLPFILGEWGIFFLCPDESPGHIMLWHVSVVIPIFGIGYAIIRFFLNRL